MEKILFLFISFTYIFTSEHIFVATGQHTDSDNITHCIVSDVSDSFQCKKENGQIKDGSCNTDISISLPSWLENETSSEINTWDGNTVANIRSITWYSSDTNHSLEISWTFLNQKFSNWTRAFLVNMLNEDNLSDTDCKLFNFQTSYFDVTDPIFKYNSSVNSEGKYNFKITSLPSEQQILYNISVPGAQYNAAQNFSTLKEWKTVLVVGADQYNGKLYIVIPPAPSYLSVAYYIIEQDDSTQINKTQDQMKNGVEMIVHARNQIYKINVTVYGVKSCTTGCSAVTPLFITMPGIPQKPTTPRLTQNPILTKAGSSSESVSTVSTALNSETTPVVISTTEEPGGGTNVWVIVAVVLAAVLIITLIIIGYCVYRRSNKQNESMQYAMKKLDNDSDTDSKTPSVLILYSYDCPAHEQVVIEFANFLKSEWYLEVHLDVWQQKDILERGDIQWLNEKIIMSQFVIVVSSTGARYKCARNRQFRLKYDRPVPDMFPYAVDLVLERCKASKLEMNQTGTNSQAPLECIVVSFHYSCENDVPPKLDTLPRFTLTKQLFELYCHLCRINPTEKLEKVNAISPTKYKSTKSGKQLNMVLTKAKDFFENNPDWLAELLEPVSPPLTLEQQQNMKTNDGKQKQDDSQPDPNVKINGKGNVIETVPKGNNNKSSPNHTINSQFNSSNGHPSSQTHSRMSSNLSSTEEDALLEERKNKRLKEEEAKMERVASSSKLKDMVQQPNVSMSPSGVNDPGVYGNNCDTQGNVKINGWDNSLAPNSLSVHANGDKISIHSHSRNNSDYSSLNRSGGNNSLSRSGGNNGGFITPAITTTANTDGNESSIGGDFDKSVDQIDADELQRDIDFIHNNYYDLNHEWDQTSNPAEVLINMDFTGYTPPENIPLSLTYKHFGEYSNPLVSSSNNHLKLNGGPNLDFTNPMYFNLNGDINNGHLKSDSLTNGLGPKSDKNDNFIIDFEIPQDKLQQLNKNRHISENSETGTHL